MQILIKLIHNLNDRLRSVAGHRASSIRSTCAILLLSLSGLTGAIEPAQADSQFRDNRIAQKSTTRLDNKLDLPTNGAEVRTTGNRSIGLQEALDTALRNNRQIQASRLNIDRSRAAVTEAEAARALTVGLNGNLTGRGAPLIIGGRGNLGADNTSTSARASVEANYNILNGGGTDARIQASQEQVKFDELALKTATLRIKADTIAAYYDLQQADSAVTISQASIKDATRSLSDAQLQEKAGVGTKFDILRAQVQLATSNQDLVRAQGQQQTARKRLSQLLSVDEGTEFRAADPVRETGSWDYSLEDSVVLAYKNRPELRQQLVNREIAKQQETASNAANAPQVNLFAQYGADTGFTANSPLTDGYSLGARVQWNFLDGGSNNARSLQQKVNQEIAENNFTNTRNQVKFEVAQSYSNLKTNQQNIVTSTQALKQAEESLKLARLRFQAGVGIQTDVIQAQTELARARGNRVNAILEYNRSLSNLKTATALD
jgi:outer membrane protein TolC